MSREPLEFEPVPDWHRALIRERLAAYRADPSAGRPWSEVREDLQRKYKLER